MKKETALICMQGGTIGCKAKEGSDWSPHRSTQDPAKECSFSTASQDSNNTTIPAFDDVCSKADNSSQPFSIVIPSLRQSPTPIDLTNSLPCEASARTATATSTSLPSFHQSTIFSPPTNPNPFLDAPLMLRAVSLEPSPSETTKRRRSACMSIDGGCQAMEEDVPMHPPRNRKRRRIHERKQALGSMEFNDILGQIGPISAML